MNGIGERGEDAWGAYANAMIIIARNAAEGTVYHEAFHAVFHLFMTPAQRQDIINEAQRTYPNLSEGEIEERLAEQFRRFVTLRERKDLGSKIKVFFDNLAFMVKNWLKIHQAAGNYFRKINNGEFKNASSAVYAVSNNTSETSFAVSIAGNEGIDDMSVKQVSLDHMHIDRVMSLHGMDELAKNTVLNELAKQIPVGMTLTLDESTPILDYIELEGLTTRGFIKKGYNGRGMPVYMKIENDGIVTLKRADVFKREHTKTDFASLSEEDKAMLTQENITPEEFDLMPELLQHNMLNC